MSKFSKISRIEEIERQREVIMEYRISAKGWIATGSILCKNENDSSFWYLLQSVVESVLKGDENKRVVNESYRDGFSRYLRPLFEGESAFKAVRR